MASLANADGGSLCPSVEYVAWLTSKTCRAVQRDVAVLLSLGVLDVIQSSTHYRSRSYRFSAAHLPTRPSWNTNQRRLPFPHERDEMVADAVTQEVHRGRSFPQFQQVSTAPKFSTVSTVLHRTVVTNFLSPTSPDPSIDPKILRSRSRTPLRPEDTNMQGTCHNPASRRQLCLIVRQVDQEDPLVPLVELLERVKSRCVKMRLTWDPEDLTVAVTAVRSIAPTLIRAARALRPRGRMR
mgnify:FL=1